jgi:hypothetical protein
MLVISYKTHPKDQTSLKKLEIVGFYIKILTISNQNKLLD